MKVGKLRDIHDSIQILSDAAYRDGVMDGRAIVLVVDVMLMLCRS